MITVHEDKQQKFVTVRHTGSGDSFRLHEDDLPKIGTEQKVSVYELNNLSWTPPNSNYPKGRFGAKVKYFVASYLIVPVVQAVQ